MKKTIISTLILGSLIFASCGGNNAEAEAAKEQARIDSINNVLEQARLDSIANEEEQAKITAELEQARLDSIEAANAANASKKGGTKSPTKTTPAQEEPTNKIKDLKSGGAETKTEEEKKKEKEGLDKIRNLKGGGNK